MTHQDQRRECDWLVEKGDEIVNLTVSVKPGARKTFLEVSEQSLKLKIRERPVEGAANRGVIHFFSELFKLAPSQIRIIRGEHAREKVVQIQGLSGRMIMSFLASQEKEKMLKK